ncbi:MAG TPA: DUF5107 domain-containing protein [Clostridia bacterium]
MSVIFTAIKMPGCGFYEPNPTLEIKEPVLSEFKFSSPTLKNQLKHFGEGMVSDMLPYLQQDNYDRVLREKEFKAAVLENEHLKAVILTEYGGRLYSLYDKTAGRELLYKNRIFQLANLALRNAWFSGGVEWNVAIKGHNPFTCSPVFAVKIKSDGEEGLRIYEYERKRSIVFSIDFWLPQGSRFLYVLPRIENAEPQEKYMYWWSNIAVPEEKGARVIVPASKVFVGGGEKGAYHIDYKDMPYFDGRDSSYPETAARSNDYFYHLDQGEQKWIVSVDSQGKGLLQASTDELIGRKMFVWGRGEGGENWNNFLSDGDRYIEIQAGLSETQLQHLKMPGKTVWEWVEVYGAIDLSVDKAHSKDYSQAVNAVKEFLGGLFPQGLDAELKKTAIKLKNPKVVEVFQCGSGWGALKNIENQAKNLPPISDCVEFYPQSIDSEQKPFLDLVSNGYLEETDVQTAPQGYVVSEYFRELLRKSLGHPKGSHWFSYYHLGAVEYALGNMEEAEACWRKSFDLKPNAWSARNLAMLYKNIYKQSQKAAELMKTAVKLKKHISLYKDCAEALIQAEKYDEWLKICEEMPEEMSKTGRIRYYKALCLSRLGKNKEASEIINENFVMEDIREGELSLTELWYDIYGALLLNQNLPREEIIKRVDQIKPIKKLNFKMD